MATMRLSDGVVPSIFNNLVNGKVTELSNFRNAGLIRQTPEFNALASGTGFVANLPFWSPIAHSEALSASDDPSVKATPRKVSQGSQVARRFHRVLPFSAMDLIRAATGGDATAYAISQIAAQWAIDEEKLAIAMLKGIEADNVAANSSDMVKDVAVTTGTARLLDLDVLIDAATTMGDAKGALNTLVVHSTVHAVLQKTQANAFVPKASTNLGFDTYAGYRLVVSDNCPVDETTPSYTKYTSYLMGSDALGYGLGDTSTAFQRDELAGNGSGEETVVSRRSFIMHVNGFKNDATPANGVSLTNSEVDDATSWSRQVDRKAVPIAIIKTN